MDDLISRQAAIDALRDATFDFESCEIVLKQLPSVQPEQRTGKWIKGKCDKCGEHAPFYAMASTYHESNFCPHCGAKMEGVSNGKKKEKTV